MPCSKQTLVQVILTQTTSRGPQKLQVVWLNPVREDWVCPLLCQGHSCRRGHDLDLSESCFQQQKISLKCILGRIFPHQDDRKLNYKEKPASLEISQLVCDFSREKRQTCLHSALHAGEISSSNFACQAASHAKPYYERSFF